MHGGRRDKERGAGWAGRRREETECVALPLVRQLVSLNSTFTSCDHRYMLCLHVNLGTQQEKEIVYVREFRRRTPYLLSKKISTCRMNPVWLVIISSGKLIAEMTKHKDCLQLRSEILISENSLKDITQRALHVHTQNFVKEGHSAAR